MSAGWIHSCGLRESGTIECWGDDSEGRASPPAGVFTRISAGWFHSCALHESGAVECWGWDEAGRASPPAGRFTQVDAGYDHTCGLLASGAVECWGNDGSYKYGQHGRASPPAGRFAQISAGRYHSCGVRESGAVECWGWNGHSQASPPAGRFTQVSAGELDTCGLRESGAIECWGANRSGQVSPPAGRFTQVSAGRYHSCGLRESGTVECWGWDGHSQASPPAGRFTQVSAGEFHSCGLRESGAVECWGPDRYGEASPPGVALTEPSVGEERSESDIKRVNDKPDVASAFLRIAAQRLADGRTEFALELEGGERILPRSRYFPAAGPTGRWLNSSPIQHNGLDLGRINARRLADGKIEFGFTPTGGERILPRSRKFPVNVKVGRWLLSSAIKTALATSTSLEVEPSDKAAEDDRPATLRRKAGLWAPSGAPDEEYAVKVYARYHASKKEVELRLKVRGPDGREQEYRASGDPKIRKVSIPTDGTWAAIPCIILPNWNCVSPLVTLRSGAYIFALGQLNRGDFQIVSAVDRDEFESNPLGRPNFKTSDAVSVPRLAGELYDVGQTAQLGAAQALLRVQVADRLPRSGSFEQFVGGASEAWRAYESVQDKIDRVKAAKQAGVAVELVVSYAAIVQSALGRHWEQLAAEVASEMFKHSVRHALSEALMPDGRCRGQGEPSRANGYVTPDPRAWAYHEVELAMLQLEAEIEQAERAIDAYRDRRGLSYADALRIVGAEAAVRKAAPVANQLLIDRLINFVRSYEFGKPWTGVSPCPITYKTTAAALINFQIGLVITNKDIDSDDKFRSALRNAWSAYGDFLSAVGLDK